MTRPGTPMTPLHDRPMAVAGLTSYRYRGGFGWVMIGATDAADALREAARSVAGRVDAERLQVWDGGAYRAVAGGG